METLAQYLEAEQMPQSALARQLRVDQSTVSKWVSGESIPRKRAITEIAKITEGRVGPASWFETTDGAAA